jgi:ppGpp synthetase/RelA/SpoT-type nucleotidyltranferase
LTAQTLDQALQQAGIRAIVTFRAKSPDRAVQKATQRALTKTCRSVDDVYRDLVDLAGVRLALYFPGERDEVDKIVKQKLFLEEEPRRFPSLSAKPSYKKRFSGYWATHYRTKLPESLLSESEKRYQNAMVEIQVASILMHAWSEVEHDLVYKPLRGRLSEDEYEILDELNGLVLSGEIALERLQKAGERRVAITGRSFENHYDLATYLLDRARHLIRGNEPETVIGIGKISRCLD